MTGWGTEWLGKPFVPRRGFQTAHGEMLKGIIGLKDELRTFL